MIRTHIRIFFIFLAICFFEQIAFGQLADFKDATQQLGSVKINDTTVGILIKFERDSALLASSITKGNSQPKYIPLSDSTYRGFPKMTINILTSNSNDEIWIQAPAVENEPGNNITLAHYRLGSDIATSLWGTLPLSDSISIKSSVGGRPTDPEKNKSKILATFYFTGEESPLPTPTKPRKGGWWPW